MIAASSRLGTAACVSGGVAIEYLLDRPPEAAAALGADQALDRLPNSIGHLRSLIYLNAGDNHLKSLPDECAQLGTLRELRLQANQITRLPEIFGALTQLRELHLDGNRLTALPDSIGALAELRVLSLRGNRLTTVPRSIGALTRLQVLDLRSNCVETLPEEVAQLAALDKRVSLFETLKRKYGGSIAEVIAFGERAAERMQKIEGRDAELERLAKEITNLRAKMNRAGEALRKLRTKAAPKLSENIRRNLRDLGFRQSEFEAKLSALDEPRPDGFDSVELLFSPNPGEPLKPLRAIASSGEISRLMLAIKSALAAHDAIPLLVFDEIDTNVGGEIAHAVGAKMQTLGRDHQVICITHLPQVAANASSHFVVTKDVARGRTFSNLHEISGKARQEEIARMLGGKSDSALKLAASLLKQS